MATTSKEVNLYQLDVELGRQGLIADLSDPKNKIITPADGSKLTEKQLEAGISAHVAVFEQPSINDKLASVGVTIDDLKSALGL